MGTGLAALNGLAMLVMGLNGVVRFVTIGVGAEGVAGEVIFTTATGGGGVDSCRCGVCGGDIGFWFCGGEAGLEDGFDAGAS